MRHIRNPTEAAEKLVNLAKLKGGCEYPTDDVTVVVIRLNPRDPPTQEVAWPSVFSSASRFVQDCIHM